MTRWLRRHPFWAVGTGLAMGGLLGVGMLIGSLVTRSLDLRSGELFPPALLQASATDSGDMFAMATGPLVNDVEGVFFLDFLTGDLRGFIVNDRTRAIGGYFEYNVIGDLGVVQGKKQKYLVVVGAVPMIRGTSGLRPTDSVVYVADANTGNFAVYALQFNGTAWASGSPQKFPIGLLMKGSMRNIDMRGP